MLLQVVVDAGNERRQVTAQFWIQLRLVVPLRGAVVIPHPGLEVGPHPTVAVAGAERSRVLAQTEQIVLEQLAQPVLGHRPAGGVEPGLGGVGVDVGNAPGVPVDDRFLAASTGQAAAHDDREERCNERRPGLPHGSPPQLFFACCGRNAAIRVSSVVRYGPPIRSTQYGMAGNTASRHSPIALGCPGRLTISDEPRIPAV